jgi:hypothetical protein
MSRSRRLLTAAKSLSRQQVGFLVRAAVLTLILVLVDNVGTGRGSNIFTAIFGPVGALWVLRIFLVTLIFAFVRGVWIVGNQDRRVTRLLEKRAEIDTSIRRDV